MNKWIILNIHLCKARALEDAEQDRHDAVAEETANVGVHSHLKTEGGPIYDQKKTKNSNSNFHIQ